MERRNDQIKTPDGHSDGHGAVGYVKYRPPCHNEIGEVEIQKIRYASENNSVDQVAEGSAQDQRQREADGLRIWIGAFFCYR